MVHNHIPPLNIATQFNTLHPPSHSATTTSSSPALLTYPQPASLPRMSLSPNSPDSDLHNPHSHKRARTDSFGGPDLDSQSPDSNLNLNGKHVNGNGHQNGNGMEGPGGGIQPSALSNGVAGHASHWAAQGIPPGHIPKRGARACTACRKGKNRCEGENPCRRCQLNGTLCIFEKPDRKSSSSQVAQQAAQQQQQAAAQLTAALANPALERVVQLEGQILLMQNNFIGMQSSLDRILHAISPPQQQQHQHQQQPPPLGMMQQQQQPQQQSMQSLLASQPQGPMNLQFPTLSVPSAPQQPNSFPLQLQAPTPQQLAHPPPTFSTARRPSSGESSSNGLTDMTPFHYDPTPPQQQQQQPVQPPPRVVAPVENGRGGSARRKKYPALPGYAAPPHKFATYGIVPSTAPSSDDESEDTLPRSSLAAPIEALQGLANAAAEAAALPNVNGLHGPISKKRKRVEPTPPNAFPSTLQKGLIKESEARELYNIFFSQCHLFMPMFDPNYDTFESLAERTPFCFDSVMAVAAKIRAGSNDPGQTFYTCLENAQGIARSTLFGPVVRKEAVQATLVLAAWSQNAWLPAGHAVRMALDLGLHRALDKLVDHSVQTGRQFTDEEERDLILSARIWLCLYWFDHQMSLGTGRPIILPGVESVRHRTLLLDHRWSTLTDLRLVSMVELIIKKHQVYESLLQLNGLVDQGTLAFVESANIMLDQWWRESDEIHKLRGLDEESLLRKILASELWYTKLWLICTVLRGASWEKMSYEQKELAFRAKEAASNCLSILINSDAYQLSLRFSVQDTLVSAAFSALFLLKLANLFPTEMNLADIITQVAKLAQLLQDAACDRYALSLRFMLSKLRRKMGLESGTVTSMPSPNSMQTNIPLTPFDRNAPMPPMSTLPPDDFGMNGLYEEMINGNNLPVWLQGPDLGFPGNISDDLFLQLGVGPATWGGVSDMSYIAW